METIASTPIVKPALPAGGSKPRASRLFRLAVAASCAVSLMPGANAAESTPLHTAAGSALFVLAADTISTPKHVLLITSQPYVTEWFRAVADGLDARLFSALPPHSKLSVEYIGGEGANDPAYRAALNELLRKKYGRIGLDLVITVMPSGSQFMLDHGDSLFPGLPAVFVLPSRQQLARISTRPRSALIQSDPSAIPDTIERIRTLLPATERLVVVSGAGPDDAHYRRLAEEAAKRMAWPATIDYLEGLSAEELGSACERLPPRAVVLMLTSLLDRKGAPLSTVQIMNVVTPRTAVPIFSFYDTVFGLGIVGGKLSSAEAYGTAAAEAALRLLRGEGTSSLVTVVAKARDVYDWRQLERWGISTDRLPPSSEIRHRKVPYWEEHLAKIVVVAVIMLLQAVLIVALLLNLARRRRAEAELARHRDHLEELVAARTAELEVAKERAESADRLKSAFLATMSHELRTPLNSIIGFTGILIQRLVGSLNEEQDKQLQMVYGSAKHLLELINDVLDLSKIEANQITIARESFDLRSSVEKVVKSARPLADKKAIELSAHVAPEIGAMESDRRRVEQILFNLISNGIKFTERGFVRVRCDLVDGRVVIAVTDSGIGVKQEDLGLLFQPFRQVESGLTRKYEGTGLGLSICKKLANLLGGDIQVSSVWGVGSTFSVIIPMARDPA